MTFGNEFFLATWEVTDARSFSSVWAQMNFQISNLFHLFQAIWEWANELLFANRRTIVNFVKRFTEILLFSWIHRSSCCELFIEFHWFYIYNYVHVILFDSVYIFHYLRLFERHFDSYLLKKVGNFDSLVILFAFF